MSSNTTDNYKLWENRYNTPGRTPRAPEPFVVESLPFMQRGKLLDDGEIKDRYALRQPYGEWLDQNLLQLHDLPIPNAQIPTHTQEMRDRLYQAFGYTHEQVKDVILPMAPNGQEATAAMGSSRVRQASTTKARLFTKVMWLHRRSTCGKMWRRC